MKQENTKKRVSIRLFGVFSIKDFDGNEMVPSSKRGQAIIAMLMLSPNGVRHRKWLQEKLWSTRSDEQRATSLRQELSRLKRHFSKYNLNLVIADRETVRLSLKYHEIQTDIETAHSSSLQILEGLDLQDGVFRDWLNETRSELTKNALSYSNTFLYTEGSQDSIRKQKSVNQLPSIYISSFKPINNSDRSNIFAQGLTEELLTVFGQLIGYFSLVTCDTSPESEMLYKLEGAVRFGNVIRVSARLIEQATTKCIWSQRFNYKSEDHFSVQEEIARACVETTQGSLSDGNWAKIWGHEKTVTNAWEYFQHGRYFESQYTPKTHNKAIDFYAQANQIDNSFYPATVAMGFCHVDRVRLGWASNSNGDLEKAIELAYSVLTLHEDNGYAVALLAFVEVAKGNHAEAASFMKRSSIMFDGESPELLAYEGAVLGHAGDLEGELNKYQLALSLTIFPPVWIQTNMALVYLLTGDMRVESICQTVLTHDPNNLRALVFLTAHYSKIGEEKNASRVAHILRGAYPEFNAGNWGNIDSFKIKAHYHDVVAYLKNAGL